MFLVNKIPRTKSKETKEITPHKLQSSLKISKKLIVFSSLRVTSSSARSTTDTGPGYSLTQHI
jgi:hypothetical protein